MRMGWVTRWTLKTLVFPPELRASDWRSSEAPCSPATSLPQTMKLEKWGRRKGITFQVSKVHTYWDRPRSVTHLLLVVHLFSKPSGNKWTHLLSPPPILNNKAFLLKENCTFLTSKSMFFILVQLYISLVGTSINLKIVLGPSYFSLRGKGSSSHSRLALGLRESRAPLWRRYWDRSNMTPKPTPISEPVSLLRTFNFSNKEYFAVESRT